MLLIIPAHLMPEKFSELQWILQMHCEHLAEDLIKEYYL